MTTVSKSEAPGGVGLVWGGGARGGAATAWRGMVLVKVSDGGVGRGGRV